MNGDLHLGVGAMKEEMSSSIQKPIHSWRCWGPSELKGNTASERNVLGRQVRESTTEIVVSKQYFSSDKWLSWLPQWMGAGCWVQASGVGTQEEDRSWLLWSYSEGASMTQQRGPRENPRPPTEARNYCLGTLWAYILCRPQEFAFMVTISRMGRRQWLWNVQPQS